MVCCNLFLDPRTKKKKIQKIKNICSKKTQKIIIVKKGYQNAQKMTKKLLRRFKNTEIKI
jgi:hypothetical protein